MSTEQTEHPLNGTVAPPLSDPHHDPRLWQECTHEDIRKGDMVEARDGDLIRVGVAHHQDEDGDWYTEDCGIITLGDNWTYRRAPAPTPPAEEQDSGQTRGVVVTVYDRNPGSHQPVHVPGSVHINGHRVYVAQNGFTVSTDERGTPIVTLTFMPTELHFTQEDPA